MRWQLWWQAGSVSCWGLRGCGDCHNQAARHDKQGRVIVGVGDGAQAVAVLGVFALCSDKRQNLPS